MQTNTPIKSQRRERPNGWIAEHYMGRQHQTRLEKKLIDAVDFRDTQPFEQATLEGMEERTIPGFCTRWYGLINAPQSESYTFYLTSLHGVRFWINEVLLVDRWDKAGTLETAEVAFELEAGKELLVRVEYTAPNDERTAVLEWSSRSLSREVVPKDRMSPFVVWEGGELPPVEPLFDYGIRDCQIMLGHDGNYYMTGTNGPDHWNNNDGIHIWKSPDMKEWTDLGLIWSLERDATWASRRSEDGRRPLWAPELHYIKGTYWLTYSMGWWDGMRSGLLKSVTGLVEGPYEEVSAGPLVDSIDATLFEDDDGQVYFIYAHCLIAKMNEDMTGFAEPFRPLVASDGQMIGFEGAFMVKHDGKYHLVAAKVNHDYSLSAAYPGGLQSYDSVAASSDNIYGPYGDRYLALRHGGHSALFRDKQGDLWMSIFIGGDNDNVPFQIRPAAVRMRFREDGKLAPQLSPSEIVAPSVEQGASWRYATAAPSAEWALPAYDDGEWQEGAGGFGEAGLPGSIMRTEWDSSESSELWLRRSFQADGLTEADRDGLYLSIYCTVPAQIYLNGVLAAELNEGTNYYRPVAISGEAKAAMAGTERHVLAIYATGSGKPTFVDAGITLWA